MKSLNLRAPVFSPGFWPAFSYSVLYLTLIVLIPRLSAVFLENEESGLAQILEHHHFAACSRGLQNQLRHFVPCGGRQCNHRLHHRLGACSI